MSHPSINKGVVRKDPKVQEDVVVSGFVEAPKIDAQPEDASTDLETSHEGSTSHQDQQRLVDNEALVVECVSDHHTNSSSVDNSDHRSIAEVRLRDDQSVVSSVTCNDVFYPSRQSVQEAAFQSQQAMYPSIEDVPKDAPLPPVASFSAEQLKARQKMRTFEQSITSKEKASCLTLAAISEDTALSEAALNAKQQQQQQQDQEGEGSSSKQELLSASSSENASKRSSNAAVRYDASSIGSSQPGAYHEFSSRSAEEHISDFPRQYSSSEAGHELEENRIRSQHYEEVQVPEPQHAVGNDINNPHQRSNRLAEAEPIEVAFANCEDSEPSEQPHRKFSLVFVVSVCFLSAVIIVIIVQVALAFATTTSNNNGSPSDGQTPWYDSLGPNASIVQIRLKSAFGENYLEDPNTPQSQAFHWTTHDNRLLGNPYATNLIQRFVLVQFYYATTQNGSWIACDPQLQTNETLEFCYYQALVGDGRYVAPDSYAPDPTRYEQTLAHRWLSAEHECKWAGLFCQIGDEVTDLRLDKLGLDGTMPVEVSRLTSLRVISLSENSLHGTLPSQLALLQSLEYIALQQNKFTGKIPEGLLGGDRRGTVLADGGWLPDTVSGAFIPPLNLQYINLEDNPLDPGPVPSEIGRLSKLDFLNLNNAGITGTLPKEYFKLTDLVFSHLRRNSITGPVPTELGLLTNLQFLSFLDSQLTGTIPSEIALLRNIIEMDFWGNPLTGTIPEELYFAEMPHITGLIFGQCQLSGTISTDIGRISSLRYLLLPFNYLRGTIPSELGQLPMEWFDVRSNYLTGSVPHELCALRGDELLSKVKADCGPLSNGTVPVTCESGCCTHCFNQETGETTETLWFEKNNWPGRL